MPVVGQLLPTKHDDDVVVERALNLAECGIIDVLREIEVDLRTAGRAGFRHAWPHCALLCPVTGHPRRLYVFLNHMRSDFTRAPLSKSGQPMARILLAEPDRAIREFIAGILTEFGHDVQTCTNTVDANVWLATAPVDVLVTDMVLRGSQGLALSRRSATLGIPTITLTGWEFHAEDGVQNASPTLLEKPFRF